MSNKTEQWHGGKGSYRRNANDQAYKDNWDKIFGTVIEAENCDATIETEEVIKEESEMDRYERHMEPIRKAQAKADTPVAHFPPFND